MVPTTATAVLIMVSALLILIFSSLSISADSRVSNQTHLVQGTGLVSAYSVEKAPLWNAPLKLLAPLKVTVNCSSNAYAVVTAASREQLHTESATKVLWCGWRNIFNEPNVCQFQMSTLQDTYFAVKPVQTGLLVFGQPELDCVVTTTTRDLRGDLSWRLMALGAAVVLFRHAAFMARSQAFRLTSGGVMGITGFAVVLLLILFRNAPAKKAIGAGFAISTTSMAALIRWLYGTWAPGFHQVVFSRVGVWYVILTGAGGVALTYWLDDPHNEKINTSIRVGLQGLSLALVYASITDERVAIAAVLLLSVHRWLLLLLRGVSSLLLKAAAFTIRSIRGSSLTGAGSGFLQLPDDWEEVSYHSSQDTDYDPSEEEPEEEEDGKGGIVSEYDSDDAPQGEGLQHPAAPAPAADGQRRRHAFIWRSSAAAAAGDSGPGGTAAVRGDQELGPAPSFDSWAQQQDHRAQQRAALAAAQASLAGAAAAGNAGQGGVAGPSTGGWGPALLAVDRAQQGTSRQQMQPQQEQPGEQRPSSTSPWSERKVLDITEPKLPSPPSAGAGAAAAAVGGSRRLRSGVAADGTNVSPLVLAGRIQNPETGRSIALDGHTYNQLLDRGFEPDFVAGTLVLSAGDPTPPAAASARSSRGAPSPAGNLRARKPDRKH